METASEIVLESRPASDMTTGSHHYLESLTRLNHLNSPPSPVWYFYPGMLFLSLQKWWGDFKWRHAVHEGLDIAIYQDLDGRRQWLRPWFKVSPMTEGVVINICSDFLGHSVIVEHQHLSSRASRIVTVYSHLSVDKYLGPGDSLQNRDVFATLADTVAIKSQLPSHLHISVMEIDKIIPAGRIDWTLMGKPDPNLVKLYNPADFVTVQQRAIFAHSGLFE